MLGFPAGSAPLETFEWSRVGGGMTLSEIKTSAAELSPEEQQELLLFLAARLRAASTSLPAPRTFGREQLNAWIADDESGMRRFKSGE